MTSRSSSPRDRRPDQELLPTSACRIFWHRDSSATQVVELAEPILLAGAIRRTRAWPGLLIALGWGLKRAGRDAFVAVRGATRSVSIEDRFVPSGRTRRISRLGLWREPEQVPTDPAIKGEAAEIIRSQIERITLTPNDQGTLDVHLYGDLARILQFCEAGERNANVPAMGSRGVGCRWLRGHATPFVCCCSRPG